MSIRLRFTLALTAVGVLLFGVYALWAYRAERDDLREAADREIRIVGQSLETSLGHALRDKQRLDIEEALATLAAVAPDVAIHIHNVAGAAIAHSHEAALDAYIESLAARAAVSRVEVVQFDPPDEPRRVIFAGPLRADDGSLLGSVTISKPTTDMNEDLARTRYRHLVAMISFTIATLVIGLILGTLNVTRPIKRLLTGVRQVREGDFRARVRPGQHDEIGQLVDEFNAMIGTLAEMRGRIESEADARTRLELGLQRVDKLVTIGQLSAGLAHEIGSPLQVLSGRAAALTEHSDPEVRRQAGLLVTQCDRITRVIEQLLSFGRRKAAHVGPCDLTTPVVAVIDMLGGEARRRKVTLQLHSEGAPHEIIGDVDQLQQVTLNLVRNALAATPTDGEITVRVDHTDDVVRLSVRDSGAGIAPDIRERLFEPFFTTRASEGGTGLGLAVVQAIASEHHAKIDVRSEPGKGAEFIVSFPREKKDSNAG